jgi:hypothetical protein
MRWLTAVTHSAEANGGRQVAYLHCYVHSCSVLALWIKTSATKRARASSASIAACRGQSTSCDSASNVGDRAPGLFTVVLRSEIVGSCSLWPQLEFRTWFKHRWLDSIVVRRIVYSCLSMEQLTFSSDFW